jgi:hypothetical protein
MGKCSIAAVMMKKIHHHNIHKICSSMDLQMFHDQWAMKSPKKYRLF